MRIAIRHELTYTPPAGAGHAVLQLLLTPQSGPTQKVLSWSVEMPGIGNAGRFSDAYGNTVHLVNQAKPEGPLAIAVNGVVETRDAHGVLGRPGGEPVPALYRRATTLTKPLASIKVKPAGDATRISTLHALMNRIGEVFGTLEDAAEPEAQSQMQADGGQSQSQSQSQGGATPRPLPPAADYAHAFIGAARALLIPARYVTGYLLNGEDGQTGFHAWAEAYDERLGWIGFDPLLQLCPTDRHVRLAVGLDAYAAQPVRAIPAGEGIATTSVSVEQADGE